MEKSDQTESKTKVLVNVYEPLIAIMKRRFDAVCLKRDAYLDKALRLEAGLLREEAETPNSDEAKNYIADNLKQLRLKPLNLLLSTETVELMNEVCKEKNVPRDTFINRVFFVLLASDTIIDALFYKVLFGDDHNYQIDQGDVFGVWAIEARYENPETIYKNMFSCYNRSNVINSIEEFIEINPFWRLRDFLSNWSASKEDWKFYTFPFEKRALNKLPNEFNFLKTDNIIGLNTFMTDWQVATQKTMDESINKKMELDKLLDFAKKDTKARQERTQEAAQKARPEKTKQEGETQ